MFELFVSENNKGYKTIGSLVIFLIIKIIEYLAYFFLTVVVLTLLSVILFIGITITKGELSFEFLKYFSFILPKLAQESISLDISDIMKIFGAISFSIFILFNLTHLFFKRIIKKEINVNISLKQKVYLSSTIILFLHLGAIFLIPYASLSASSQQKNFYFVFLFFLILSLISNLIYLFLIQFSKKLYFLNKFFI